MGRERRKELPPAYHGLVAQCVCLVLIFHIRYIFRCPKGISITILALKGIESDDDCDYFGKKEKQKEGQSEKGERKSERRGNEMEKKGDKGRGERLRMEGKRGEASRGKEAEGRQGRGVGAIWWA